MPKRILVCEFHQESNTFNPVPCALPFFGGPHIAEGHEAYEKCKAAPLDSCGIIDGIEAAGGEVVCAVTLVSGSGGRVKIAAPAEVREEYEARVMQALEGFESDGAKVKAMTMDVATPIEEVLDCSHTVRVLHKAGVDTMEELSRMTYDDLMALKGIGKVIATDVTAKIKEWNSK